MSGLDDRETARDPLPQDPEDLSFDEVQRRLPRAHPLARGVNRILIRTSIRTVRIDNIRERLARRHSAPPANTGALWTLSAIAGAQGLGSTPSKTLFPSDQFGHLNSPPLVLPRIPRKLFGPASARPSLPKTAAKINTRASKRKSDKTAGIKEGAKEKKKTVFIDESPSQLLCPRYYNAVQARDEATDEVTESALILLSLVANGRRNIKRAKRLSMP
ncbi:hypothetical protein CDD81_4637 [Ophiocordyceps australis]|uniref:Uncharacterized protein n=1 Tax=Ophiocordyceps australis TaxID=1399860 RepID=A0A2C5Y9M4_9HYPO|nr:hypothetical protein CDD81_4637 [Ophiocordyceps australis]